MMGECFLAPVARGQSAFALELSSLCSFAFYFNAATENLNQIGYNIALKYLIIIGFKAIKNFTSYRHNCLEIGISRLLTSTESRVTLYNKQFSFINIF